MLNWICHVRPTHSPCEGPEDTHFTITVRSKVWRGAALAPLKLSLITFLFRLDLAVWTTVPESGNLNALRVTGLQDPWLNGTIQLPEARWVWLPSWAEASKHQSEVFNSPSLWCWLLITWFLAVTWKPTKFLFALNKQQSSRWNEQNYQLSHKNRDSQPLY